MAGFCAREIMSYKSEFLEKVIKKIDEGGAVDVICMNFSKTFEAILSGKTGPKG